MHSQIHLVEALYSFFKITEPVQKGMSEREKGGTVGISRAV